VCVVWLSKMRPVGDFSWLIAVLWISLLLGFYWFCNWKTVVCYKPALVIAEETLTHSHQWGRRRRIRTDNTVHCVGAHPLYSALSQWGLLDPIKPAYCQSWPDGKPRLTASAFKRILISMLAVLVTVSTVMCYAELDASVINLLCYCSPSSGFYSTGKDNRGRRTDNLSGCHHFRAIGAPTSIPPTDALIWILVILVFRLFHKFEVLQQQPQFYGHYTGQPALACASS